MITTLQPSELISPAYVAEQRRLHAEQAPYGHRGKKWAVDINATRWVHGCQSVLDYGCGTGSLAEALRLEQALARFTVSEYDPAIPGKDALPAPADLVVCTDVLEHVEPELIDNVLDHVCSLARKAIFAVIALVETAKTLSDGRQAHILLKPIPYWEDHFSRRGFVVERVVGRKPQSQWDAVLRRVA